MTRQKVMKDYATPDNPLTKAFARRVREWRGDNGKTLKEMANAMELSISIVCEWEHGRRFPSVNHLYKLAQYTGIPASEFVRL
jgi:transcriptional regulator with XRE-family HTH domain